MSYLPAKVTICDATGTPLGSVPLVPGNPTSVARGSQTATNSAVALGGATAYTGGIDIWNTSTTDRVALGASNVTDAAGSGKIILGPGQGYHEPTGNLAALYIIAASGSPIVSWVGSTL